MSGSPIQLSIAAGTVNFVLGANGTGKSSLLQRLYTLNRPNCRRIIAHRQNWLNSNTVEYSASNKLQQDKNMSNQDLSENSRWRDDNAAYRAGITIYDLIEAENVRSRGIAASVTNHNLEEAIELASKKAPTQIINSLLAASNIQIVITAEADNSITARKKGGDPYSVAELSDGERNALLIGASVLTAPQGCLVLVDEPERHLHRSSISPFLTLLFTYRPDCAFVVSTHDLSLPLDNPTSSCALVRGCVFSGSMVTAWDVDILAAGANFDEALKADILGARRKILFVEGDPKSLDKPLYSLLFPDVTVLPKETSKSVKSYVDNIVDTEGLHWIRAFGIVDRDQLTSDEVEQLQKKRIFPLDVYSVESLYFHPDIQRAAAQRNAEMLGADVTILLDEALTAALEAIAPHIPRLAARLTVGKIRGELTSKVPDWKELEANPIIDFQIDTRALLEIERTRLSCFIQNRDLVSILQRFPIRETGALNKIVHKLRFKDRSIYESVIRNLVATDAHTKALMLSFFGALPNLVREN